VTQAAVCFAVNDVRVVDHPLPSLAPGDAVVRVQAAGICGTDVRIVQGKKTRGVVLPRVLGHEIAGWLQDESPEARVAVLPTITCGVCWACTAGREHLCEQRSSFGYAQDGGFAELLHVPALARARGSLLPLPAGVSPAAGALVEPLACCLLAHRLLGVEGGGPLLILGGGPMGLLHLMLARHRGSTVIVSDPRAARRDRALALGAAGVVEPRIAPLRDQVLEQTGGQLPPRVVVATASLDALQASLMAVRRGGVIHLFAGYDDPAPLEVRRLHNDDVRVVGSSGYDAQDAREALRLIASGAVPVETLVSHRFPLARIHQAMDTVAAKSGFKVLVEPDAAAPHGG